MMENIIVALITGLCVAIPNLYQTKKTNSKLDDNDASNKAMKQSMISLLRSQIVSKCETYQKEGSLPDYARACLTDLFLQYETLGGNHGVKILVDETLKLPPTNKEN